MAFFLKDFSPRWIEKTGVKIGFTFMNPFAPAGAREILMIMFDQRTKTQTQKRDLAEANGAPRSDRVHTGEIGRVGATWSWNGQDFPRLTAKCSMACGWPGNMGGWIENGAIIERD